MCGSILGGGSKPSTTQTLVSAPAATNVTQNTEDQSLVAASQDKKRSRQYGASKTRKTASGQTLGSSGEGISLARAYGS